MGKRKIYHITKNKGGKWQGKKRGTEKASVIGNTQQEVIAKITDIAKHQGHSQVFIHRGDNNRIRDERTYNNDPFPPKG
ncbi:hypothetical protein ES702_07573 [subsurface metagenome]